MKTYRCSKCRYKIQKDGAPKDCNYCGEKSSMKEIEDAEGILKMID